ncbi:structural maintenance of chromosomes protein 3 [Trichomonascus vanleenenianus]|uniref:cohesin subunit SMC3 n=1 Tax=Trichomonascus vanleenenianus TaxID=2268995 RepID=UPI003ECAF63A
MHIKRIVIQGFKSYKNETIAGPFSPHNNVVVGRNGSGKSNFFAAIRFVLGDAYKSLGKEDRSQLLHDGAGNQVMTAYVEIVFDNSDGRLIDANEEVVIRRTVGLKKDDYSLDKKSSSKQEIANLLENAGFSQANPYYIVPQGRVTALTNAKAADRLKLLKEVAGTEVYESKRTRSLAIMNETQTKRAQIDESLDSIRKQMDELEQETKALEDYEVRDREKRCLDYTLLNREINNIVDKLMDLERELADGAEISRQASEHLYQLEEAAVERENRVNELNERIQNMHFEQQQAHADYESAMQRYAEGELELSDYTTNKTAALEDKTRVEGELHKTLQDIERISAELERITPEYEEFKRQENEQWNEINALSARKEHLQVKQGQSARFDSPQQYEAWLNDQIQQLRQTVEQRRKAIGELQNDVTDIRQQRTECETYIDGLEPKLRELDEENKQFKQGESTVLAQEQSLQDEKRSLWREENTVTSKLETIRTNLRKAEQGFAETMSREMYRGLNSVQRIVRQKELTGVYGTVAELINFDNKYKTAIEVTAGNSLFHVVVDSDETATNIMDELKRTKGGRVTFMPLNRLNPRLQEYPQNEYTIPMIEVLQYDDQFARAVRQVFSQTLVCRDLESSRQFAQNGLSLITLSGDRFDSKGVVSGGFHDVRKSRMDAVRRLQEAREALTQREQELAELQIQIRRKDQEITRVLDERHRVQGQIQTYHSKIESTRGDMAEKKRELLQLSDLIERKEETLSSMKSSVFAHETEIAAHEADLASGFNKSLSDSETQELENAKRQLPSLQASVQELSKRVSELGETRSNYEFELRETLYPRQSYLQNELTSLQKTVDETSEVSSSTQGVQDKLAQLEEQKRETGARVDMLDRDLEDIQKEIAGLEDELAKLRDEQLTVGRSIERHRKRVDTRMAKKAELSMRRDEMNSRVRELGVIPEDSLARYERTATEDLIKRNQQLNEELKGYKYVNKKAIEQHGNFVSKRDDLLERREELVESEKSINDLILTLDQRKDEAITRTFRQVSKYFSDIFKKLVPNGGGSLVMQRRSDESSQSQSQAQEGETVSVENYVGVDIVVSFNSQHDEQLRIEQLSGGQKSLCALALIFAIQKCDPAPFYLFDEVDANLDTQYRTAVANMIKELSTQDEGQFICTTFRPEMLHVADSFFGVSFKDNMSSVSKITEDVAMKFIEGASRR